MALRRGAHRWLSLLGAWGLRQARSAPGGRSAAAARPRVAPLPQASAGASEHPHPLERPPARSHLSYLKLSGVDAGKTHSLQTVQPLYPQKDPSYASALISDADWW